MSSALEGETGETMGEPEKFEDRIVGERLLGDGRVEQTILRLYLSSNKRQLLTRIIGLDDLPEQPGRSGPQETA